MPARKKLVREPRPSKQIQRKVICKVQADMQLNKADNAWKSSVMTGVHSRAVAEPESDPEQVKTQVVLKLFLSILNKLTPEKIEKLVKQVTELDIDTEERLRGVMELTFKKAISEPSYAGVYARMCHGLMGLTVQTPDGLQLNFNKLLLKRCQTAFEKDKDDNQILKKKQEELEAASGDQEKKKLTEELEEIEYKAKRESVGTMKFIGELFKVKMLIDAVMFDCIGKLLKDNDEVSLECLCTLVSTIGQDLDLGKSKTRLDGYFSWMKQIITEQTSNRIRFRLQDVLDLRRNKWVQGPKTIGQIRKEAKLEGRRFNQPQIEEHVNINDMKNVEFTLGEESKKSQEKELSSAEQKEQLDTLIQDKADNHTISDWIENNLDEQQTSSNTFIRTLMTCICQSTIISGENYYIVDHDLIRQRATLLQKYLQDEEKQLQALSALQALMVQMDHPSQLLRMFFDCLYDFNVITVRTFYKWELNKDPAEQQGKDVALQSVTGLFFAWLHEVN